MRYQSNYRLDGLDKESDYKPFIIDPIKSGIVPPGGLVDIIQIIIEERRKENEIGKRPELPIEEFPTEPPKREQERKEPGKGYIQFNM